MSAMNVSGLRLTSVALGIQAAAGQLVYHTFTSLICSLLVCACSLKRKRRIGWHSEQHGEYVPFFPWLLCSLMVAAMWRRCPGTIGGIVPVSCGARWAQP